MARCQIYKKIVRLLLFYVLFYVHAMLLNTKMDILQIILALAVK